MGRLNVPGRVSVVLATYNGADMVDRALDSLLEQTYDDLEIVVVDDGSSDHTLTVVRSSVAECEGTFYGDKCAKPPVTIYHTNGPNHFTPMGGLWPYIVGAGNSTGEFLSFHSQDDWSEPDRFEKLVAAIGDRSLVYSKWNSVDHDGVKFKEEGIDLTEQIYEGFNSDSDYIPHILFSCGMFRKDVFFRRQCYLIGQYNYEKLLTMRLLDSDGFSFVNEPLYNYRHHPEQASRLGSKWPEIVRSTGYEPEEIWNGRYNYGDISNVDLKEETMRRVENVECH